MLRLEHRQFAIDRFDLPLPRGVACFKETRARSDCSTACEAASS